MTNCSNRLVSWRNDNTLAYILFLEDMQVFPSRLSSSYILRPHSYYLDQIKSSKTLLFLHGVLCGVFCGVWCDVWYDDNVWYGVFEPLYK